MIRLEGTVKLADGTLEHIEINQRDYTAWEIWSVRNGFSPLPAEAPPMLWTRYLGYAAHFRLAGTPRNDWPVFEDWDAADVELEAPETDTPIVNPTRAVRSAG